VSAGETSGCILHLFFGLFVGMLCLCRSLGGVAVSLVRGRWVGPGWVLAAKFSEAIDAVSREEGVTRPELKHTRCVAEIPRHPLSQATG
jgi:hypothetical protein